MSNMPFNYIQQVVSAYVILCLVFLTLVKDRQQSLRAVFVFRSLLPEFLGYSDI